MAPRSARPARPARPARRARHLAALAGASLALALALGPTAAATPAPAPAPAPPAPADLLAQARQAQLVLAAIAAAAAGRPPPPGLSPQVAEDIARRLVVDTTLGNDARLVAFAPDLPIHWERGAAPSPDTATLQARLLGTVTVAGTAGPGRPARTDQRPLARRALVIALARRDGRWVVTDIRVDTGAGGLAR